MTTSTTRCQNCGAQVAPGNRFCTECGQPMDVPRFCGKCGTPLASGVRFCGNCGAAVATTPEPAAATPGSVTPQPAPTPEPAATAPPLAEPVVGVIAGVQRRKGLLGHQTFNLVVTPSRLVFALMTDKMMKDAVREASERAKREGKGLLGRIAAQMGWLNLMVERYSALPVEAALAENRENFFIPNNTVQRARLEQEDDDEGRTTYSLRIEAVSGKYGFKLTAGNPGEAREVLRRALGAAVR